MKYTEYAMKKLFLVIISALTLGALAADNDEEKSFKPLRAFAPGERVAFIGDSITHSCNWIAYLKYIVNTRYAFLPEVEFLNFGVAGDSAWNVKHRLDWDILPYKFDRAFIMLGMNDCTPGIWSNENPSEREIKRRNSRVESYIKYMTNIISRLEKSGVEVVLVTPSPFDEYSTDLKAENFIGRNERGLTTYAETIRQLAGERTLSFVDFHKTMTAVLKKSPELKLCGPDRVHPRQNGSICMAAILADAMGIGGYQDSEVSIDYLDKNNKNITYLPKGGIRFLYANRMLPFPTAAIGSFSKLEKSVEAVKKLKSEYLTVKNLPKGKWILKAGNNNLGIFSDIELSEGIDLSYFNTPSQLAAGKAKEAMEAWRDKIKSLRNIVMTRQILKIQKVDPYDVANAMPVLDKWLTSGPGKDQKEYFGPIFKKFEKTAASESELRKSIDDASKAFFLLCKGVSYDIEVIPAE
jgi:lysophospholipase L1-like esterase